MQVILFYIRVAYTGTRSALISQAPVLHSVKHYAVQIKSIGVGAYVFTICTTVRNVGKLAILDHRAVIFTYLIFNVIDTAVYG